MNTQSSTIDSPQAHLQYAASVISTHHNKYIATLTKTVTDELKVGRALLAKALKEGTAGDPDTARSMIESAEAKLKLITQLQQAAESVLSL